MAIPGFATGALGATVASSEKGKKFLSAFTDFMKGGGLAGMAGRGVGSFAENAMDLNKMNGTKRMDTGETSQGAQELAQKVEQNEKTGVQQRLADFMNKINPFDRVFPDNRVDYVNPDGTTQKVNPDFDKLLKNRPDLKKKFDTTGSIYSDM